MGDTLMDSEDTRLHDALWTQVAQWRSGKIEIKKFTPLGLPYLFKRNQHSGKMWSPCCPHSNMTCRNEWTEDGATTEQDCAMWIDHYYARYNPIGYYGA